MNQIIINFLKFICSPSCCWDFFQEIYNNLTDEEGKKYPKRLENEIDKEKIKNWRSILEDKSGIFDRRQSLYQIKNIWNHKPIPMYILYEDEKRQGKIFLSFKNLHIMLYERKIFCNWNKNKENNKKNEIGSRLKNNNYINSRNQSQPESGINSFPPKTNSFLIKTFYYFIFTSIQEGIRLWSEGIYTGFWLGLIPGINIIFFIEIQSHFSCCSLCSCSNCSKSFARRALVVRRWWFWVE